MHPRDAAATPDPVDASHQFYGNLNVGFLVAFAHRVMLTQQYELLARRGITDIRPAHGYILLAVQNSDATLTELVDQMHLSKQALSPIVVELEDRGLVRRTADPSDRRRVRIRLTPRGKRLLEQASMAWTEIERAMAATVSDEAVAQFRELLVEYLSAYAPIEARKRPTPEPIW